MAKKKKKRSVEELSLSLPEHTSIHKVFEEHISNAKDLMKEQDRPDILTLLDLDGEVGRRREASTVRLLQRMHEEVSLSWDQEILDTAWGETSAVVSVPLVSADREYDLTLATAIGLLDSLDPDRRKQALTCLGGPERKNPCPCRELRDTVWDSDTLHAAADLLWNRYDNLDGRCWLNRFTAARTAPPPPVTITRPVETLSTETRFRILWDLVPQEKKERSARAFEKAFWSYTNLCFSCMGEQLEELVRRVIDLIGLLNHLSIKYGKMLDMIAQTDMDKETAETFGLLRNMEPALRAAVTTIQEAIGLDVEIPERTEPVKKVGVLSLVLSRKKREELEADAMRFLDTFESVCEMKDEFSSSLPSILLWPFSSRRPDDLLFPETAKRLEAFSVEDPLEICLGYLSLLEQGSDIPWACGACVSVLLAAARRLPWTACLERLDNVDLMEMMEEGNIPPAGDMIVDMNPPSWGPEHEPEAPALSEDATPSAWMYVPRYSRSLAGSKRDECRAEKLSFAQVIWENTGLLAPRTLPSPAQEQQALMMVGAGKGDAESFALLFSLFREMGRSPGFGQSAPDRDNDNGPSAEEQLTELKGRLEEAALRIRTLEASVKEIRQEEQNKAKAAYQKELQQLAELKEQNRMLKSACVQAEKDARAEKEAREQMEQSAKADRREMEDLRELLYRSSDSASDPDQGFSDSRFRFPCRTKKRVVVFGGYDEWRNQMKKLLPNVVCVSTAQAPNRETVRKADVVWIQSRNFNYQYFYPILNLTRGGDIPIRYFQPGSAQNCASQILRAEQNS